MQSVEEKATPDELGFSGRTSAFIHGEDGTMPECEGTTSRRAKDALRPALAPPPRKTTEDYYMQAHLHLL